MIAYYSKKLGYDLGKINTFHITYGEVGQTNLPNGEQAIAQSERLPRFWL